MSNADTPKRENEALWDCISKLSAASLRINASLDLGTVLSEAVESACELTGARYGVMATVDDSGQVQDVVSAGLTPEEDRQLADWPDGLRLFAHFRDLPGALRLRDLPGYVRSLGFSTEWVRWKIFQGTPLHHRGIHVGNFFLAEKKSGGEFTSEDEQVLVLFSSQAAAAIANARTHRAEQQARADLEELERSRAEFLSLVIHELRAPLTSIKGSTATVLGASPSLEPAEMLQFFHIIDKQADHMRGLISDLLDAGCIETGALSVTPEPTEVANLVEQARNTFLSGGGRHTVLIDLPWNLPPVLADRRRIVQVLNNLFSNASRHAPASSPIRVGAVRDGVYVAISVSDEGRGVSPDLLPYLFRKHTRVGSGDQQRGIGGSGLGLVICKGLVEAHGGRIRAESGGKSQGTRFTFTIPVAEQTGKFAMPGSAPGASRSSRKEREGRRILVVDDDPMTLRYVRDALTAAGHFPLVTGDPREVADLVRTKKPHLVLLDLLLPGTDGIDLMERLPELSDLPVIFLSAYGRDETIARALESGAADYIVKPFSPTELAARVQAALRRLAEPQASFQLGDLAIHYEQRQVTVAGHPLELTATEYEVLRVLSVNAGRITTYDSLLRQVWSGKDTGDSQSVRAYVKRLRRKLGDDAANPEYIFNVRQVGYRMPKQGED